MTVPVRRTPDHPAIRFGTPEARWVLIATVLGSGIAFLDGTVVNVALPTIGEDLDTGMSGLQWTLDAYLVTLSALLLLGGALGDRYGRRRMFVVGLVTFSAASLLCAVAPTVGTLIAARAVQGVAAAFLVPGSLAIISASFHPDDRAKAIGAWSGLTGVSSAVGPFVGGWLIDAVSWRLIFLLNLPLAAVAVWIALRHVPETWDEAATGAPDWAGGALASVGLAAVAYALIEGGGEPSGSELAVGAVGVLALVAFLVVEARQDEPMLPLALFRSGQFSGANATTFAVYAGLGAAFFLVVLQLQLVLDYSALEAGAALLPVTALMLVLSPRAGALAQRIGPRLPMTVGPLVVAAGLLLFTRVDAGATYFGAVVPAAVVFGLGLSLTVAPLTAAVLGAADERHIGAASGVNNAVARVAGLLAVAVLPGAVGLDVADLSPTGLSDGYDDAMVASAVLCVLGAVVAFATVRTAAVVTPMAQADVAHPCHDPCVAEERPAA